MTFRNNRFVSPTAWKTIIKDGMWNGLLADTWDAKPIAGSPAIDTGVVSGTTRDIVGTARPQGARYDVGAYEVVATP